MADWLRASLDPSVIADFSKLSRHTSRGGELLLEICAFDPADAVLAADSGADRIELCIDYLAGGLTPPLTWIDQIKQEVDVPLVVMVRPRGGDFFLDDTDWQSMQQSAEALVHAGADALVFGGLTAAGELAVDQCRRLIESVDVPCVLHRAFDEIGEPFEALEAAIEVGFSRVLTAWGSRDLDLLTELKNSAGTRIDLMPGGGIRCANAHQYLDLGFSSLHSAAITDSTRGTDAVEVCALKRLMDSYQDR